MSDVIAGKVDSSWVWNMFITSAELWMDLDKTRQYLVPVSWYYVLIETSENICMYVYRSFIKQPLSLSIWSKRVSAVKLNEILGLSSLSKYLKVMKADWNAHLVLTLSP